MFNSISSKEEPVRAFGVSTRTAARHVGGGDQAHPFYTSIFQFRYEPEAKPV
jgi:hypothetical protein